MKHPMTRLYLLSALGIAAFVAIAIGLFIRQTQFRLISSSPASGATNIFLGNNLTFKFSEGLDPSTTSDFSISPELKGVATVNGSTLMFAPTVSLSAQTTYTVTISHPLDSAGRSGSTVQISFTTGSAYYSALPKSQQQADKNDTDAIQNQVPITQYLPQNALDYSINYTVSASGTITYMVTLNVIARYAGDPTYIPALKNAQTEALNWIKSVGGNPAMMNIVYNPDPNTGVYTPPQ
jgi:hypothetical protein